MIKFIGFAGYKDHSFRIVFKDTISRQIRSVPLNKTDVVNWRSNMSKSTLNKLIKKYSNKL